MRALILANGDPPSASLLLSLHADADLFIATDGAAETAASRGLLPDVVLGDFDSLGLAGREALSGTTFVEAACQDANDLDKAIAFALEQGARSITVAGGFGGRLDQALTTLALLLKYAGSAAMRAVDDQAELLAVQSNATLRGEPGDTVSLIALSEVRGVTTEGLQWPLANDTLSPGSRGVSNVMTGRLARIEVASGVLIVCHLVRAG